MKKFTLFILTVAVLTVLSGVLCFADAPDSGYQMVLNDEFDGTELNTDIWKYRTGDTYGGRNLTQNVRIADGKLYLDYTKTGGIYSGAGIITNNYLPYGYYETKAKLFTGVNGFHSSFWTAGGILEIDAFEADSNQGTNAPVPEYNLHYWWADHSMVGGKGFDNNTDGNTATSDWFVSGFEWLPGKIVFYSNGKAVGTVYPDVYSPSDLWLTAVAVPDWYKKSDGTYNIDDSKMDANGYFGSSEYEYFRYYNKKLKGVNLLGNGHFELNRNKVSTSTSSFDVVKNAMSLKTPYTHSGYCIAYLSNAAELGQSLNYLAGGTYTFEGYFKTKGTTSATISVYNKAGTLLKSKAIPECNDWTLVSLSDVAVEDCAYAVVKTASGILMADDLSFYCQEGDTAYENYEEGDYKKYNALPDNADYPVLNSVLIAQLDSVVYQYKNNPYAFSLTDSSLTPYSENGEIYIPYQAIKSDFSVSGVDSQATYVSLSRINASGTYKAYSAGSCIIICKATDTVDNEILLAAQVSLNNFSNLADRKNGTATYKGTSDVEHQTVYDIDTATFTGSWSTSSLGYASKGRYTVNSQNYVTWNPVISIPAAYSIQIYSTSHQGVTGGASPSTSNAGVDLTIGGKTYTYTLNQYDGEIGWYDLGNFELTACDYVAIKLYNASGSGILRASAIRIIPVNLKEATYVGTQSEQGQIVYDINSCVLTGSWGTSSMGYAGGSRYSSSSDAKATWTVSSDIKSNYSIQIYSIAHAGDTSTGAPPSTTAASVSLEVSGKTYHYIIDQCTGSTGWYDLGTFPFQAGQTATIKLEHTTADGHLRANAVRIIPYTEKETGTASFVGKTDITGQELFGFDAAIKTGNWLSSGGALWGCYYGEGTAKWNMIPKNTQKYNIQVYIPCIDNTNTTENGIITLNVGDRIIEYPINQRLDTTTYMGWYTLGDFFLSEDTGATVTLSMIDGQFLRAKAARLIPVADTFSVIQNGTTVSIDSGYAYGNVASVVFVEYDSSNNLDTVQILECTPEITVTLKNANNKYKIFFWKSIASMIPFMEAYEK